MTLTRPLRIFLALFVAAIAAYPLVGDVFYQELVVHLMILGIFAMSLDLLIGFTGLVSFGHAAFFGVSGYLLAIVTPDSGPVSVWWGLIVCLGGTAVAAAVVGWFSVRTSGIYFIMITLAFAQMFFYFFNEHQSLGGSDGIFINFKPAVSLFGTTLLDLSNSHVFYYVTLAGMIGVFALLETILRAPFGQVIRGIHANEARTRALGYDTQAYKLVSFVIAGTIAGFAGFLEAAHTGIVSPGHLHWHESGMALMTVILGGMGTLYGAVLGAFVIGFLQDWFQDFPIEWMSEHWHLTMGVFVIAVVLFLPHGIAGLIQRATGFSQKRQAASQEDDA